MSRPRHGFFKDFVEAAASLPCQGSCQVYHNLVERMLSQPRQGSSVATFSSASRPCKENSVINLPRKLCYALVNSVTTFSRVLRHDPVKCAATLQRQRCRDLTKGTAARPRQDNCVVHQICRVRANTFKSVTQTAWAGERVRHHDISEDVRWNIRLYAAAEGMVKDCGFRQ